MTLVSGHILGILQQATLVLVPKHDAGQKPVTDQAGVVHLRGPEYRLDWESRLLDAVDLNSDLTTEPYGLLQGFVAHYADMFALDPSELRLTKVVQ